MNKNRNFCWFFLTAMAMFFAACTTQKQTIYFSGVNSSTESKINAHFTAVNEAKICENDLLAISISALEPKAAAAFNPSFVTGGDQMYSSNASISYLVDNQGNVTLPNLGKIHLAGLTKSQAIAEIKKSLEEGGFLNNPIVSLAFLNYKISVLGEVNTPGVFVVHNEKVTILDALALAGDMTIYGRRDNVLLTRETDGKLQFVRINLNSDEIFCSPYFYLQQNDVLYIEPNNVKVRSMQNQNTTLTLKYVSTITTSALAISATIFLLQHIIRK